MRELKIKTTKLPKAQEMWANKSWLMLILHLIGWESGASFLDQSQREVKQMRTQSKWMSFRGRSYARTNKRMNKVIDQRRYKRTNKQINDAKKRQQTREIMHWWINILFITLFVCLLFLRGRIKHTEVCQLLRQMSPPVGIGKKCPKIVAYKVSQKQIWT